MGEKGRGEVGRGGEGTEWERRGEVRKEGEGRGQNGREG